MTVLDRLFADDTAIGHIANDKDSLQDMVNLDLAYIIYCQPYNGRHRHLKCSESIVR